MTPIAVAVDVVESVLDQEELRPLLDAAESSGTIRRVELHELLEPHELAPLELEGLERELEARGFELLDEREEKKEQPRRRRSRTSRRRSRARPTPCSSSCARPAATRC